MHGIVNKAIQEMITESHGYEKWTAIMQKSGVNIDYFITNESYNDDVTLKLASAAGEILGMPIEDILIAFGEYWILKTGKLKYGSLFQAGGCNLKEFLVNMPSFHNRIILIYPNLTPPEFKISNVLQTSLHVHYYSRRPGLQLFVKGLLQGLGKLYDTPCIIEILQTRDQGYDHEIYKISW